MSADGGRRPPRLTAYTRRVVREVNGQREQRDFTVQIPPGADAEVIEALRVKARAEAKAWQDGQ